VPIPGTKQQKRLKENLRSLEIKLSENDLQRIEEIAPIGVAAGTRYPEALMHGVNR
jgi:aryl-alcohol dehydrogenase-like predicted oxidoreductase